MSGIRSLSHVIATGWSSLEIVKLAVAACTPFERAQWTNQKLIERRIAVFDEMAPLLNDLFCFFRFVGDFRAITPPEAVSRKRSLDRGFRALEVAKA